MSTTTTQQVEERIVDAIATFGPDKSEVTRDATFESGPRPAVRRPAARSLVT